MKRLVSVLVVFVLGFGIFGGSEVYANSSTPTIFLHGYTGDNGSLSALTARLSGTRKVEVGTYYQYTYIGSGFLKPKIKKTIKVNFSGQRMTYIVQRDGKIVALDTLKDFLINKNMKDVKNNYVVVEFDGASNSIDFQRDALENIIKKETKRLGSSKVNLLGHSMGGMVAADYMFSAEKSKTLPKVENIATFGSPLHGKSSLFISMLTTVNDMFDGRNTSKIFVDTRGVSTVETRVYSYAGKTDVFVSGKEALYLSKFSKSSRYVGKYVKSDHFSFFKGSSLDEIYSDIRSKF